MITTSHAPAGAFTMKLGGFVVVIPSTLTANRTVLTQGQTVTVPAGGAFMVFCSDIKEVAGFV